MTKSEAKERVAFTADEGWEAVGGKRVISRASWYAAIKRNEIPHPRIGRKIVIPRQALLKWLESAGMTAQAAKTA
jgi:excisionase family DNA binding protein